jgi:PAS domain S-box-containing protein
LSHIDTGDVLLVITAVSDVTKHKQAVKRAQLTAAVVEYSDDAIIGSTLEGVITSWNPAAERMYGYSSEQIIGRYAGLLSSGDQAGELRANLARIRAGQPVEHLETIRVRKDGSTVPVAVTFAPIRDDDGVIVGVSAVHRDVTDQRRAFEAAQHMAAIVENSDDAILSKTIEGIITSWNPAAERMYGYSSEEVVGKPVDLLSPQTHIGEMHAILGKIKAGQPVEHLETIRVRKDGTVFPVSLTVSPIRGADRKVVGVSTIARDLTEQEHAAAYARSLIETDLYPLVTISPGGKINDVNEATVKVTGVTREELVGTDFSQYFTDPDKAHEGYARAFAQGSLTDYPLTLVHQRRHTDRRPVQRLGLPRLQRERAGRASRRTRRLNAAPAAAAHRATAGGLGVTGRHRTGQRDNRPAPWSHDRSGLPAHTRTRPQQQRQLANGCRGDR